MKKRAVVIGGGNGSAISIQALKQHLEYFDISAVVSMSDSGGSSGVLREEFNTLPPGDIMRAVLAMSKFDYGMLKVIFHRVRFETDSKLDNHNLGNLFLVLAEKYSSDYMYPIRALEQAVCAVGKVYPSTLQKNDLMVQLENGQTIAKEEAIDRPNYDTNIKITKAYLEPEVQTDSDAQEQIGKADYIFIGPGSLYCSIVATLLPKGIKSAIDKSSAKLIYVCGNAYETTGESGPTKLSEFIRQLELYLPRKLDTIVYNNAQLSSEQQEKYSKKNWALIEYDQKNLGKYNIIEGDFEKDSGGLDSIKLGQVLQSIII